jgi:hypothetical protein
MRAGVDTVNRRNFFGLLIAAPLAPFVGAELRSDGRIEAAKQVALYRDAIRAGFERGLRSIVVTHQREMVLPAELAASIRALQRPM